MRMEEKLHLRQMFLFRVFNTFLFNKHKSAMSEDKICFVTVIPAPLPTFLSFLSCFSVSLLFFSFLTIAVEYLFSLF